MRTRPSYPRPAVAVLAFLLVSSSALAAQHEGRVLVRLRHDWDANVWAGWAMGGTIRHSSTAVPNLHVVDLPPGLTVADALAACKRDPGEQTYLSPAPAAFERFGWTVATDGSRVLVGAPFTDVGAPDTRVAHLFDASSGAVLHSTFCVVSNRIPPPPPPP